MTLENVRFDLTVLQNNDSMADIVEAILGSSLKRMIPQVVQLLQLYLIIHCTTATAERPFSQLHRIKNHLRTSMEQARMNHCMILAVYKEELDTLDLSKLVNEFILRNEMHRRTFAPLQL